MTSLLQRTVPPVAHLSLLLLLCAVWTGRLCAADPVQRPNFVFILIDDMGYMDMTPNNPNSFYETPNLDRLAASGMRFTNAYAASPVCSPTRYSLMTGRYPTRVGSTNFFGGNRAERFRPAEVNETLALEEVTVAEGLKSVGYKTAFVGKWHLGSTEEYWPEHQGFDINLAGHRAGAPSGGYFSPHRNPRLSDGPEGEYLTDRLAEESRKVLSEMAGSPFLLYFSMYGVHTPLQAPAELIRKYERKARSLTPQEEFAEEEQVWRTTKPRLTRVVQNHPVYAAMIETMDNAVGTVLDELDRLGIAEQTVVCFFSDNGGLSTAEGSPTSNLPLRGGKGWVYEGGIREPFLVRSPGVTPPGSVCNVPVCSIDLLPTFLDLAGAPLPQGRDIDGVSLRPLLEGKPIAERSLYWHYPHYSNQGGFPGGAIRQGNFKLIERYEGGGVQLFDLSQDPGERNDLAKSDTARVKEMRKDLHAWYQTVNAQFLRPREPWHPRNQNAETSN